MTAHLIDPQLPPVGGWTRYGRMWRRRFPGGLIGRVYQLDSDWLWTIRRNGDTEIHHQQAQSWEQAAALCQVYAFAYNDHHGEIVQ